MDPGKVCSHIDAHNIQVHQVHTAELPRLQAYIKHNKPDFVIRRFIVDCHNGVQYWNNEFNNISVKGKPEPDADILKYLRKACLEHNQNKIYSCIELTGSTISMIQLRSRNFSPEQVAQLKRDMRIILYEPQWEPLMAYYLMI